MDTVQTTTAPTDTASLEDSLSEDLFEVLGATDLPDQEKAALLVQMIEIVQTRVLDKIFDMFNPQQRDELMGLMEGENIDETERFLLTTVPNYYDMFELEAKQLRRELVTRMAA